MKKINSLSKNIFWNFIASGINASEAIIVLAVATRVLGLEEAGVLTISFSVANLMMCIGKYGVRSYQVTDSANKYSDEYYFSQKKYAILLMLIGTILYLVYAFCIKSYSINKLLVVACVICIYGIEAYEEFYVAVLQKEGKLDIAMKSFSIRWIVTLSSWIICMILSNNNLISCLLALLFDFICLLILMKFVYPNQRNKLIKINDRKLQMLFKDCTPLCIVAYASLYISNAGKYAIDGRLSETSQACYGYISMPIFVVGLLAFIVFQPILVGMSDRWYAKEYQDFISLALKLIIFVCGMGILTLFIGYLIGIPCLSWLYGVDLREYKKMFMYLLIAGGCLGVASIFNNILTIIRRQNSMLLIYVFASFLALFTMGKSVANFGIEGASICNLLVIVVLTIFLGLSCLYYVGIEMKSNESQMS